MIESPKNFIEQFQNFIEHIAGVMKGFVTSINNVKPDANGNVSLTIGTVQSVNGNVPNSSGNVTVDVGVKTVNSNGPDSNGNISISPSQTGCLPLSGGTMLSKAKIAFADGGFIDKYISTDGTDRLLEVGGGGAWNTGAILRLNDNESAINTGAFVLSTGNNIMLIGYQNGTLTWDGKSVVRSVNGIPADAIGNVIAHNAPKYWAGVSVTKNSYTTIISDGYLFYKLKGKHVGTATMVISINNINITIESDNYSRDTGLLPVNIGDKVTYTTSDAAPGSNVTFYPVR